MTWTRPFKDPLAVEGSEFAATHLEVDEGVELRALRWLRREGRRRGPMIFVAGWVSSIEGYAPALRQAAADRDLYYIESREKRSARVRRADRSLGRADFSIPRLAEDLIAAAGALGLDKGQATLVGSSMGATSLIEAMKGGRLPAHAAYAIGPNCHFRFPRWGQVLLSSPTPAYSLLIRLALFHLRHFRVDVKAEPEQMERYERTLLSAVPIRMKLSAQAVQPYEIWSDLETIEAPLAVAYSPTDKLHLAGEIERLVRAVPSCRMITCPSNLFMHEAPIIESLDRFLDSPLVSSSAPSA